MNPSRSPPTTQRAPALSSEDSHVLSVAFRGHVQERTRWPGFLLLSQSPLLESTAAHPG